MIARADLECCDSLGKQVAGGYAGMLAQGPCECEIHHLLHLAGEFLDPVMVFQYDCLSCPRLPVDTPTSRTAIRRYHFGVEAVLFYQ